MKLHLLYKTDAHHTNNKKRLLGVCLTKRKAIDLCFEYNGNNLGLCHLKMLKEQGQTQGLDINFSIEEIEANKVI